jgi:hypothetical protein
MDPDLILKIFRPFSNVLPHQFIDVQTSAAEQPNNISCSVVPRAVDFPIPIHLPQTGADDVPQTGADAPPFFARGLSRESDQCVKFLNLTPLIQKGYFHASWTARVASLIVLSQRSKVDGEGGRVRVMTGEKIGPRKGIAPAEKEKIRIA